VAPTRMALVVPVAPTRVALVVPVACTQVAAAPPAHSPQGERALRQPAAPAALPPEASRAFPRALTFHRTIKQTSRTLSLAAGATARRLLADLSLIRRDRFRFPQLPSRLRQLAALLSRQSLVPRGSSVFRVIFLSRLRPA